MASESSSAVLDLNDDPTEDSEAPSVTETQDSPLIMEHGYDIAVKVDAPMKQLSTLETFVTYRVRCVCARWPSPPRVRRRYNHFKVLHKRLSLAHGWLALPPLPPLHSARQQLDRYEPGFVLVRALALDCFLGEWPVLHLTGPALDRTRPALYSTEPAVGHMWPSLNRTYEAGTVQYGAGTGPYGAGTGPYEAGIYGAGTGPYGADTGPYGAGTGPYGAGSWTLRGWQLDLTRPVIDRTGLAAGPYEADRVAKHPILTHSEDFRLFLTTPDEELDKVFKNENSALNLWGLSSLYSGGEAKPANGARVKDPEFTSAGDYLQSLEQKLTSLCALTTKLYKGSNALGTELVGLKRACDAWSVRERGAVAAAAAACGAGGGAAGGRRGGGGGRPRAPRAPAAARAVLRRAARQDTAEGRAARLEQASEAIRSELSDWIPKTRAEFRSLLLDLADRQVALHSQTLQGWEHALKLSTETNLEELFKTVSKTAVQNLSPSKCRSVTPTETEKDFDDIDIENFSNDSDDAKDKPEHEEQTDPLHDFSEVNLS
ncbi:hypothetical protein MSG28_014398 [Choristoneura fumiferana]|uniref:Uncharacterized protein n=1 Tax=Choristoneura fumiferana TaxID=7141 RepID=A0ACC0JRY4_CHOFU|nr:hypothetical protein MSG28_014398 [Choristoneura fumiferana]